MKQMKVKLYLHILITLFIVLITSASFAIYADRNDYSATANIEAIVGGSATEYIFTATSIKNFSLNVNPENLNESSVGNYIESDTGQIKVDLSSQTSNDVTCRFDLLFTWTSNDKYLNSSVNLPYTHEDTTYNYEYSTIVNEEKERDLSKVNNGSGFSGNSGTIAENLSVSTLGNTNSSVTFDIKSRFYNLPINQENMMGKNLSANIKVANVICEITQNLIGEGTIYAMMKNSSSSDANIDFSVAPTESTSGVYLKSETTSDAYPVYYYRGIIDNNNVIFDNFCWKIVRTTENAGIKLIYNGLPAADGSCNNTGTASQLASTSVFNSKTSSPADVGYMFGDRYESTRKDMSSQNGTYIYGNDVSYSNGIYTLIDTYSSANWTSDIENLGNGYYYTCFGTGNTCEGSVYYLLYFYEDSYTYYLTLNGEANIEEVKAKMFKNDNDSAIKSVIDDWYETNIKDKEEKLEDAIWCNDRRLTNGPLTSKDNRINGHSSFAPNIRNTKNPIEPSFSCNKRDSFTQNESSTGNGSLKNRVGLLTVDEIVLSGSGHVGYNISSYLNTGHDQWSMSPLGFFDEAGNAALIASGYILNGDVNGKFAVRPAISLKSGTKIISGNGSTSKPYVVE